ncbi:uncharacterized protein LOC132753977 isoform X2 [Ruditapes philippinarum]|uniref:uncharacterized protein LOC132753977 isoform X2 n=1 Tax=Ruditapes philippinarum TaxID=129788 RepID=UPI00295A9864|nr:uncharacterized protein LOC132753977 isoform X2 [Ruditapes philippinarum]
MEPIALARKGKKKKGKENKDENTDENIKNRPERNDFPRFPTEVDIMLEIVGRNVDLIQTTCTKGKKNIRGRDRACCNSASKCFDDVKGVVDELDNTPVDSFSLMSACRKVSAELKRDKVCVQRSLSRCGGPDRIILQRRFDNRVDRLYNQFYKHCSRRPTNASTSTTQITPTTTLGGSRISGITRKEETTPDPHIPSAVQPTSSWTNAFPEVTPHDHRGHSHGGHTVGGAEHSPSTSGAIIAGALTGGIVLGLVLFVAVILWCKNRRDKNGSNGSSDSAGIFFQKRPNMFSTERPGADNNNKPPVTRQESTIYAEIDEAMVNPGYKPPVPGTLTHMGYLNPVSDGDPDSYTPPPTSGRETNAPAVTTRGQLSYGPILAANGGPGQNKHLFYASTSMTDTNVHNRETILTPRNLPPLTGNGSGSPDDNYLTAESIESSHDGSLDDYEEPVSTYNSIRYTDLTDGAPPEHNAPDVPPETNVKSAPKTTPKKNGIQVLPSNPFKPFGSSQDLQSSDSIQPIAKPRRKKTGVDDVSQETNPRAVSAASEKQGEMELLKRSDAMASNRDSAMSDSSTKSSHHYFVLEPDHDHMDYENSVSSPKLV